MYLEVKSAFLGGCHLFAEQGKCFKICTEIKTVVPELQFALDEADERMMIHINHAVRVD